MRRKNLLFSLCITGILSLGAAGSAHGDVTVTVGDTWANPGATGVVAPITVDDATGIAGMDIDLRFDSGILTATVARTTALSSGFSMSSNPTPGRIRIAMAKATGIPSGSGAIIEVLFNVNPAASIGNNCGLVLQSVDVYNELGDEISSSGVNGTFTVGEPNTSPILSNGSVAPSSGTVITGFTYTVTYRDEDNDAPSYITVSIDGGPSHAMSKAEPADNDYTNGCVYKYETLGLFKGASHTYQFAASDGISPATGDINSHSGPIVNNTPPSITGAAVTPDVAYKTTTLTAAGSGWTDPDGDTEAYIYEWHNQSGAIAGATASTLTGTNFNKADGI